MSYFTQMLGLTVQNFVSAAAGMAVAVALIRGLARRTAAAIGNFWVDLVRATLYVLLPLSLVLAIALVSQGVVQTLRGQRQRTLLEPQSTATARGHRADDRRSARPPRRSRSSSSAPTAAASSTSTPRIRSRTRRR